MKCQEISTHIRTIKSQKDELINLVNQKSIEEALSLKNKISELLKSLMNEFPRAFRIENKEFPTFSLEIGGKNKDELKKELEAAGMKISSYANDMLENADFTTLEKPEKINLVRLTVGDLGFSDAATTDEIFAKAQELGLELCPPEVGPYQRLKDKDQALNDWYVIGMKQITDRNGNPDVFYLGHRTDGLWLSSDIASPTDRWDPGDEFVFRLRKFSSFES